MTTASSGRVGITPASEKTKASEINIFKIIFVVYVANKCSVCGSDKFIYDQARGEIVCAVCGAIVEERLVDLGPEWRAADADEKKLKARAGAPIIRHTAEAFTTMIDWGDRDAFGNELNFKRRLEVIRLRMWQNRTRVQTSFERNLVEVSKELERLSSAMGAPRSCVERALEICRAALVKELNKGRSIEAVAAAALYAACRMLKTPRTLDEIVKYTKASKRAIASSYRLMLRELNIKVPIDDPMLHIPRIAGRLNLSGDVVKTAMEILQKVKKARRLTVGKEPAGIAAAVLYLAIKIHGIEKSQKEVAAAAGVTEVTVRNGYKEIVKASDINRIPDN